MIEFSCADHIAVVTLAHPSRGNALSEQMVESLIDRVTDCVADESIHTLVLNAAGSHFCTGFDLGASAPSPGPEASELAATDGPLLWRFTRIEHLLSLLWNAPLRTVSVAQGRTWGAGADLFLACDLRMATPETEWRFPGAGFGLVLGTRRLASLVGQVRALDWVAHGRRVSTPLALASGLMTTLLESAANSTVPTAGSVSDGWRGQLPELKVDRCTYAQLKAATRQDHSASDLAALVRSGALPGLSVRLETYRGQARK